MRSPEIADRAVGTSELGANAVDSTKIAGLAVTTGKLGGDSVTAPKLAGTTDGITTVSVPANDARVTCLVG